MRLILWAILLAILLAVAAWFTRPGLADFDTLLRETIQTRIATTDVDGGGDALETVALVGCKLKPSACFDLIRQSLDVVAEDRTLFTRFSVKGFDRETTCTGAFTKIWCERPLLAD
ncbi:MAG: hypothetical protein H5U18_05430 [Rhodobacteraceae bacterium]|nr:hypothetical protein [Paracoccaceae bacterium]